MSSFQRRVLNRVTIRQKWPSMHKSTTTESRVPSFGLLFDIDGVIVRGKNVLPSAPETFQALYDHKEDKWRVPAIFVWVYIPSKIH